MWIMAANRMKKRTKVGINAFERLQKLNENNIASIYQHCKEDIDYFAKCLDQQDKVELVCYLMAKQF